MVSALYRTIWRTCPHDYVDEETNEHVIMRVADYIRFDLERDDLIVLCRQPSSKCWTKLLNIVKRGLYGQSLFPCPSGPGNISRFTPTLSAISTQLSKYHTKFRELEQEEDKLITWYPGKSFTKDAYILHKIKDIQAKISILKQVRHGADL